MTTPPTIGTTGHVLGEVDHTPHYNRHPSGIECILISECLPPGLMAAFEYIWRYRDKGSPIRDLEKAIWRLYREQETFRQHPTRYEELARGWMGMRGERLLCERLESVHLAEQRRWQSPAHYNAPLSTVTSHLHYVLLAPPFHGNERRLLDAINATIVAAQDELSAWQLAEEGKAR